MAWLSIVSSLMLIQYFVYGALVGAARVRTGVKAPAMSGHPEFERYFRVHQNTLEQLIVTLPAMWIFGQFFNSLIAAGLGCLFIVGRVIYLLAYVKDPAKRSAGFMIGGIGTMILMFGSLVGGVMALV